MRVPYTPANVSTYDRHFADQTGGGGINVFRGHGIGNILGGLFRSAIPVLKSAGKSILKTGAQTGLNVLNDVLSGESVKSAARKRSREAGKQLLNKAVGYVGGSGAPPGQLDTV